MADNGSLSSILNGLSGGTSSVRSGSGVSRGPQQTILTPGQGNVSRDQSQSGRSQKYVNLDGQSLNKAAPRGTYLNILV